MANEQQQPLGLEFRPLTPECWENFEDLFGEKGACGGCWCMWLRLKRSEYESQKGAGNRRAMKAIVDSGEIPGLLAYDGDKPVGWCAVGPREVYPVLQQSRTLKPVDDKPVWSITCFFIDKAYRGRGVMGALIGAASQYARDQGATLVEGYPVEPKKGAYPPAFAWPGIKRVFDKAGFVEVARRSQTRPMMRYVLG